MVLADISGFIIWNGLINIKNQVYLKFNTKIFKRMDTSIFQVNTNWVCTEVMITERSHI